MRKAATAAFQIDLFDYLDGQMKKPEEPKKMVMFPTEFSPKEKQVRERIRRQREAEPSAAKRDPAKEPLPKQVIIEEPAVQQSELLKRPPVTASRKRPPATPETVREGMSGVECVTIALIGISGLAAAGMSIYHGYHYLLSVGKTSWVAMITAVVMVIFSSSIFAFPFKRRRFFSYALRILGLATISFSIFSTIAINFNQFSTKEEAETQGRKIKEANRMQIELISIQLDKLDQQIEDLKKEAQYWQSISWARRDAADTALNAAYTERSMLWQEINTATEDAYQVLETETIFTYLSGIFHIKKNMIEFILFCVPAIFYDVLSALAINTILRGNNYRKKEEHFI
jgi:hypothetical protein